MNYNLYYPLHTPGAEKIFPFFKNITCIPYDVKDYSSIEGKDIDILIANTRLKINLNTFTKFPSVHTYATISTGIDHVNFDDLQKAGKTFINSPGANASSVAEYCIVSMLHFVKREELQNETVGLIGFGHTGRCLAKYLDLNNIRYRKFDPLYPQESDPLEEVLASSIVSFHVSLISSGNNKTASLVDEEYFSKMKNLKMILNTSRGEIFSSTVLQSILANKQLYKILDVFDPEPINAATATQLLAADNLIMTPHIAGYSQIGRVSGTWRLAARLAKLYDTINLPPLDAFLEKNTALKTESFLVEESNFLKNALLNGDYQWFEKRRNKYPLRGDMTTTVCPT